ncbi:Sorting nexin-12 [Cyphellophora attinorum]|uniref:Sorting nexin-12 n=1 Tax=Cyphellophora attinorum TaxID=1664694 RepID=A0A0N0NQN0_9EURO|nr:Sorting nexin-12 [Phialophora attinorum]KPI44101.1 Sorting nexin-12 [Phialophora attinorum]
MLLTRNNLLLAAFAAFIAWGLAVQSFPVLRFIGYAFTLGAVSTVVLLAAATLLISRRPRPAPTAAQLANKPLFLTPAQWRTEAAAAKRRDQYQPLDLYTSSFVVSQAIDTLLGFALRDFVSAWYRNITTSPAFVNDIDKKIRLAIQELLARLASEDIVNVVVTKIVPIFNAHMRDFDQAERLVKGRSLNRSITESEELDLAIAAKYKDGKLHPAASLSFSDTKSIEQDHLRKLVVRILPELVSEDVLGSRAALVLVKEIIACAVLLPIVQLLKDPDTWNQVVENYGRSALQDRKTVRRMRAALDEHTASPGKARTEADFPRLGPHDSERAFERFVRAIRKAKNLSDARRFRSQVASQLKRESMVEGQDPVYLRRLEMGKRVLDQKITKLALSTGALPGTPLSGEPRKSLDSSKPQTRELTLVEIMHTASGLSYFMEFMDRQQLMTLVQFWIVVDGFRNPLEDDFGDDPIGVSTAPSWTDADRTDIARISEAYMAKAEIDVPTESKQAIRSFLVAGRKATQAQYREARMAILSTQSAVLEQLQTNHYPSFKKSDLYYKFLATDDARITSPDQGAGFDLLDIPQSLSPVKAVKPAPTQP